MENYWSKLSYKRSDFSTCDAEPIRFCGAIQSYGWFLAFEASGEVFAASENCEQIFDRPLSKVLGAEILDLFTLSDQFNFHNLNVTHSESNFKKIAVKSSGQCVQGRCRRVGNCFFLDLESCFSGADQEPVQFLDQLQTLVHRVDHEIETESILAGAVTCIQELTSFDRVMIYRFEPNDDGLVIAEAAHSNLVSFLHNRYPASDIPPQARLLYLESKYRLIADVHSEPVPIHMGKTGHAALDMGLSTLRAVSPFHIQYLKNMGVRSAFSLPLNVNGKLWGLISCHNYEKPAQLSIELRSYCELASQIISSRVSAQIVERQWQARNRIFALSQSVLNLVADGRSVMGAFQEHGLQLLEIAEASGAYVRIGGDSVVIGNTPPESTVQKILEKLASTESLSAWKSCDFATDLSLPPGQDAAGAFALPFSFGFEDLILWFRPEIWNKNHWGGDPNEKSNSGDVLEPRRSFATWIEQVKGKSREWDEAMQESAQYLQLMFVKGIFQKASSLSKANKELTSLTQAKDDFIGMVSHELRNPLGVIIGWINLLQDEQRKDPGIEQAVEVIDRNAKLLMKIIEELLDISRINSGKTLIVLEENINIGALIQDVFDDISPTAFAKNIEIKIDVQTKIFSSADSERMRQIIWNLLTNAIKFTPKGGMVNLGLEKLGSQYSIYVEDTGIGIAQDQLSRIFERFAQSSAKHASLGGLGLGLSIAKTLVDLHGGQIIAESKGPGQGSKFTATFPIFEFKSKPHNFMQRIIQPLQPVKKEFDGLRVLVAEDNTDGALALTQTLEKMGAHVVCAHNGKEAFESLSAEGFDLLLSDIGMPEWNGIELIKNWRSLERERRSQKVPAIAITAYATQKDRAKCLEAGFQSHIGKPVDRVELSDAIRALCVKAKSSDAE